MTTSPNRGRGAAAVLNGRRLGMLTATTVAIVAALVGPGGVAQAATSDLSQTVDSTYQTNDRVNAILAIGDTIYIGGRFTSVRPPGSGTSVARNHLAAFSKSTGALLAWNPSADKEVLALSASLDGADVFVGGAFSKIGTAHRLRLAEVDASTGAVQPWAPTSDDQVNTIAVTASELYIGGLFDVMDGQPRANLAAVDYTGAVSTTWTPSADDRVRVLAFSPDGLSLFAGGDFLSINGDPSPEDPGPAGPGDRRDDAVEVPPGLPDPPVRVLQRRPVRGG